MGELAQAKAVASHARTKVEQNIFITKGPRLSWHKDRADIIITSAYDVRTKR